MNVLIVDDDRFVVASLVNGLPWADLGFDNIYTACCFTDAKEMLLTNEINFLLSDIDMPHGSGLDLLNWLREQGNNIPTIFLTNYADFGFAQRAMELNSFRYFLKPVDFDKLSAAISEVISQLSTAKTFTKELCERFWNLYVRGNGIDGASLSALPYSEDDYFVPVLFELFPYSLTSDNTLASCFESPTAQSRFFRSALAAELHSSLDRNDIILDLDVPSSQYLAIIKSQKNTVSPLLLMDCENLVETVWSDAKCPMNCYIGEPTHIADFTDSLDALKILMSNTLSKERAVILWSSVLHNRTSFRGCDRDALTLCLEQGQYSQFLSYCTSYLQKLSECGNLNAISMADFQSDAIQVIYSFISNKGLTANRLFVDDTYKLLAALSCNSTRGMLTFLQYLVQALESKLKSERSLPDAIRDYIDQHIFEDISLNILAGTFYLDPDYITKVFKKSYGDSVKNYIIRKRVDKAKELLSGTALPVNIVASSVGYENYSYFSRLFKKTTGETPQDYRKRFAP